MSKQMVLAIGAGATAFAAVVGSAATLGGVTSDNLGADAAVVASCHTSAADIVVSYTTAIDATLGEYEVTEVTVSGIDEECADQELSVSLLDGSAELEAVTDTVDSPATPGDPVDMVLTLTDPPLAESVTRAAVVISGPA